MPVKTEYKINRSLYDKELSIVVTKGKNDITIESPFPKDYPDTELKQEKNILGWINLSPDPMSPDDTILLSFFYINTRHGNSYEKKAGKGLGNLLLCYGINEMLKQNSSYKYMSLSAAGEECLSEIKLKTDKMNKNECIEYLSQFPEMLDFNLNKQSLERLRFYVCQIISNKSLIKYYERYGFKMIENFGTHADLKASIHDILKHC